MKCEGDDDDNGFVGEVRQGSERVGFEVVTLDGRSGQLASTTISRSLLAFMLYVIVLYAKNCISSVYIKSM